MMKIKEPAVANMFYSGNPEVLKAQLENFALKSTNKYEYRTRAVIVPHAGLVYSGRLAYEGISQLDKKIKNIFIFAPAHRVAFEGLALTSFDKWQTPLGNIDINQDINKELTENFGAKIYDEAHREEHAAEVQVPFIQTLFNEIKIIPILVGRENPNKITKIIERYYKDEDNGFIISSDLSHFHTDSNAKQIDSQTAEMIETGNIQGMKYEQACGALGIYGLTNFANQNNYSLIRIDMYNSSLTTNDKARVVGYGAWFLYEGTKNKFLKEYYSLYMLRLARDIIKARFNGEDINSDYPEVFKEIGACFVTLKKNGHLRGCIGSIIPHQPLINDLIQNAQNSAFKDPRFNPVSFDEIEHITIDISVLSVPKQINFKNEEDLMSQIVPNKDGIIIRDGRYQAVYLPSVWEELPDKNLFMRSLKMKAGLHPEYFSDTFEAYKFETEYIEEN